MRMNDKDWRLVERGLGSVGRLRILRALASKKKASQTKYGLRKITGLKPVDVRKHLDVLKETGWVEEHDYAPTVYTLNSDEPKARFLEEFFEKMSSLYPPR